jgi:hypothetical protein
MVTGPTCNYPLSNNSDIIQAMLLARAAGMDSVSAGAAVVTDWQFKT